MDRKLARWIASVVVTLMGFVMQGAMGMGGGLGDSKSSKTDVEQMKQMAKVMSGYNDADTIANLDK